jgi:demethylmenaquinone methyltransferase/2-methoxy-6-polyprenyl-1,4-benzoquinol methylase
MIELARARLAPASASFIVADFFDWRPERRYDCVFFGFWLSHVPAERFDDFFARVEDCLGPGGRALFVDESAERAPRAAGGRPRRSPVVERRLRDGSAYRIVKVFHEPAELAATLAGIGWSARVEPLEDGFMAGVAEPAAALSRG